MKRTILAALFVALVGCHNDDTDTDDTAQPQEATQYQSLAIGYGEDYLGLICDEYAEGSAFCADDRTFVFCSLGSWWELDCLDDIGADFCGEDDYDDTVDCYAWVD